MNIKIEITAPGLEQALNNLAGSFGQMGGSPIAATLEVVKETPKQEKPKKEDKPKEDKAAKEEPDEAEKEPEAKATEDAEPTVSLEEVREKLAALAKAGKQAEVKKLIASFDAKKLTDIDSSNFAEVLKKAEKL